jgi:hypothetical protein
VTGEFDQCLDTGGTMPACAASAASTVKIRSANKMAVSSRFRNNYFVEL